MQKTKNIILTVLLIKLCSFGYSQTVQEWVELKKEPQANEIVLGEITYTQYLYCEFDRYDYIKGKLTYIGRDRDDFDVETDAQLLEHLKKDADKKFKQMNTSYYFRNFKKESKIEKRTLNEYIRNAIYHCNEVSVTVVFKNPEFEKMETLKSSIKKALENIKDGSRLAIDQIRIVGGDKDDFKDQIIEILLDKGYKVVAKEYLEKLLEEQELQQSGVYNSNTTVKENNLSAVGYYINVKKTESAIKVQVINVSTGEYEANVTENL